MKRCVLGDSRQAVTSPGVFPVISLSFWVVRLTVTQAAPAGEEKPGPPVSAEMQACTHWGSSGGLRGATSSWADIQCPRWWKWKSMITLLHSPLIWIFCRKHCSLQHKQKASHKNKPAHYLAWHLSSIWFLSKVLRLTNGAFGRKMSSSHCCRFFSLHLHPDSDRRNRPGSLYYSLFSRKHIAFFWWPN